MTQFYTYLHCKPDLTPFYVGKGSLNRCYQFGRGRRSLSHQNIVAEHGQNNIQVLVFKKDSEESAFKSEIRLIKMLRKAGFELCNKTKGGEGVSGCIPSAETRAKMTAWQLGRKRSPEECVNISKGKMNPSDETRRKIREKRKHQIFTAETRAKLSASRKGKKLSAEHRAKIGASKIGKKRAPFSAEWRANLAASGKGNKKGMALKGKPWSAARREAQNKRRKL